MNRLGITVLSLILIIIGFLMIYTTPFSPIAITFGMLLIAVSILSLAVLIYFPPKTEHVELRVVEAPKTVLRPKKPVKRVKKKVRRRRR